MSGKDRLDRDTEDARLLAEAKGDLQKLLEELRRRFARAKRRDPGDPTDDIRLDEVLDAINALPLSRLLDAVAACPVRRLGRDHVVLIQRPPFHDGELAASIVRISD